jgi:AAA+ superfamily predicted ATPase
MQILKERILATYSGLVLVTAEEGRADSLIQSVCDEIDYKLGIWTCTLGLQPVHDNALFMSGPAGHPADLLPNLTFEDKSVVLLRDMHLFLQEPDPTLYRLLKDALIRARAAQACIILVMPVLKLPPDLERLFSVIDFDLPGPAELTKVLQDLCGEEREMPDGDRLDMLLDAAAGLTTMEAEDAFALSLVKTGRFDPSVVMAEKAATIRKNGHAEYLEPNLTLADVGGFDVYKQELLRSRHQFTAAAAAYHLEPLKGCLLVGAPGCGKSLVAPITGRVFGVPVLRVNASNLGGSLYGQTEGNWRAVMNTAKALKKCVLYIDEIDGMTAGSKSSGHTDGGTTARLVKALLQDIQDSTGIYFIFTANDIDNIPDPLIDRLDVWSVDLPNDKERSEIWSIHIRRRHRDPAQFDLPKLVKQSEGFSGRQIERVWLAAMAAAFDDNQREPTTQDVLTLLAKSVPTATTMKEELEARRKRLANRARPVTSPTFQTLASTRKIAT